MPPPFPALATRPRVTDPGLPTATREGAASARPGTGRSPLAWPARDDPRWPFAALLSIYALLGLTVLGFNRSPLQVGAVIVSGGLLDLLVTRWLKGRWIFPLSAYITCCSLALLLNHSHASPLLLVPVLLAIGSKHLLTFRGRHVFNPSMFGVSVSLLVSNELITAAPAYQWVGGTGGGVALSLFIVGAASVFFIRKLGRWPLVASFLVFYMLQTGLRAWIMRHHLPPDTLFLGTLTAPSFFIFTFYMITDPATSPKTPRAQVMLAGALVLVDLFLHMRESVYTFFYASLICASVRFLFLHLRAWRSGERPAGPVVSARPRLALLAALLLAGGLSLVGARGGAAQAEFRMVRLPPEHTGIHLAMGNLLDQVDPRLAHVGKWLLSVGDAVAVGDYDGDGRLDLFLTNVLKRPEDRGALYRGLGDLRFQRIPLPAMAALTAAFPEAGLASGASFVDLEGDGDEDLLLAMSFGPSRLFRNQLRETGRPDFIDASREVGLADASSISLTIAAFDFDRDAVLDLYLANAAAPLLPDYPTPTPLNIFRLPRPQYPGDRRMFHFMHNGWHNADNGANVLYRGLRDGRLQRLDAARLGMPQTHWSLAVGTVDLNRDGFTDLYVANDFGPDDVYLNDRGRAFRRVAGRTFGEIGRDTYKGMNASVADFDGNGWLDVYVSNVHHSLQAEGSLLWMLGPGRDPFWPRFSDQAAARGALNERRFGWGAAAGDLNLDGWMDIVQANGMVDDRLDRSPHPIANKDYWYVNHKVMQSGPEIHTYADRWGDLRGRTIYPNEARRAYLNRGASAPGEFVDVARAIGIDDPDNSRGVALADLDDDGDLDLVVTNQHGAPSVYRNDRRHGDGDGAQPGRRPAFVGLSLEGDGRRTSRSAIGTRVELRAPGSTGPAQIREVSLAGGFSAQADRRLLFGLGDHPGPVEVTIHWYGAEPQRLTLPAGRYHHVRQGASASRSM